MTLDMPYYDEEDVIGSASKYHRPSCHLIENIYRRNLTKLQSWEKADALGLEPCRVCNPFHGAMKPSPTEQVESQSLTSEPISASKLDDWRRSLLKLLDFLDQKGRRPPRENVADRIMRLQRESLIPRHIASVMRTITEMRNAATYEAKTLSANESALVLAAWATIQEWASDQGCTV